jgi:hypothetical protein
MLKCSDEFSGKNQWVPSFQQNHPREEMTILRLFMSNDPQIPPLLLKTVSPKMILPTQIAAICPTVTNLL